jgi:hypothetical protein
VRATPPRDQRGRFASLLRTSPVFAKLAYRNQDTGKKDKSPVDRRESG